MMTTPPSPASRRRRGPRAPSAAPSPARALGLPLALALAALAGCAVQPPQPWEKGDLARPVMTMDRDTLEAHFVQHVYFSKEASSGGDGVGGGGCGCN